jgi:5-methyltetrahydrofolate--homocysteine methyltransferase
MVEYQANGYERHLATVEDDLVPYMMPWFGTGVLPSAFSCQITIAPGPGNDPAVAGPCIHAPADAAHLKMPDPYHDGWMPRVLEAIDYARAHSDLPPGLTDMQGPLDTLGLMCGQAQLYKWMYQEPKMVHELFDLVTEAFIAWTKVQKEHIGEPLDRSNGLQGVWSPEGVGIWESDDDLVLLDPALYREFVVPYVSRIFDAFGGGSLHFCGGGYHHLENLRLVSSMRVVNHSPMGDFAGFATFRKALGDGIVFQLQDAIPIDFETYYARLFAELDDLRGIMLATFVVDTMGMDADGGYLPVDWDPLETADRVAAAIRECVRKKLAGEPLVEAGGAAPTPVAKLTVAPEEVRPEFGPPQEAALAAVTARLVDFDSEGLSDGVQAAIDAGLAAMDIVTHGMAAGMAKVGRLYEEGEYFLPQLVMAGATMDSGMAVLQPLLTREGAGKGKGMVVFGTVRGDVHDIGKNIVKTLLGAAGYSVLDIGVDQPAARFVDSVRESDADIVAMSALLTTTMQSMAGVIEALEEAGLRKRVRVMVGGAPISREFANKIGAEGYAPDAVKAVREADRLMASLRAQ